MEVCGIKCRICIKSMNFETKKALYFRGFRIYMLEALEFCSAHFVGINSFEIRDHNKWIE